MTTQTVKGVMNAQLCLSVKRELNRPKSLRHGPRSVPIVKFNTQDHADGVVHIQFSLSHNTQDHAQDMVHVSVIIVELNTQDLVQDVVHVQFSLSS